VWRCTIRRWPSAIIGVVAIGLFGYTAWAFWNSMAAIGTDALGVLLVFGCTLPVVYGVVQAVVVIRYRATAEVDPARGLVRLSERVFRTRRAELPIGEAKARLVYVKALVPLNINALVSRKTDLGLVGPILCLEGGDVSVCVMWPNNETEDTQLVRTFVEVGQAMGVRLDLNPWVDRCGI
jgi:hypothetical protein